MKILHLIDSAGIYGAEVILLSLIDQQQRIGLSPMLGSIGALNVTENQLECEALRRGFEVIKIRMRRGYNIRGALKLQQLAREKDVDIVHSHGYKSDILVRFFPRRLQKFPVIRTLHGWTSTKKASKIWLYECLNRLCLKGIDAVVSVNSDFPARMAGFLKGNHTFVVENGIPELRFDSDVVIRKDPEVAEFCKNAFVIGAIGRLSAEKGWKYFIEAMQSFLINGENCKAIIIGEGPERVQLDNMIQGSNLSDQVVLAGYKDNAFNYLPFFDVFVLPSLTEGLPITILEAMQALAPIVATRVGGIPKVLGNGQYGVLVEPGNPKALTDAILYLRQHPDQAQEMARKARDVAFTKYSSQRMAQDYCKVYERVLTKWQKR